MIVRYSCIVTISGGVVEFVDLVFTMNEGVTFQACAQLQSTTNGSPLNAARSVSVATSTSGTSATGEIIVT